MMGERDLNSSEIISAKYKRVIVCGNKNRPTVPIRVNSIHI